MREGAIEPIVPPARCLEVLAQHVVSMTLEGPLAVNELLEVVRRAHPYRELTEDALASVLDLCSGRYPSDGFADLRPTIVWDRDARTIRARRGARLKVMFNPGTIPDRGLFPVHRGSEDGPKLGELDEEMVYETRAGEVIVLGASSWRVTAITRNRVIVEP
ncbi:MAG: DEAD/DEAH box helicase, partial [Planctomycetota bacterium]